LTGSRPAIFSCHRLPVIPVLSGFYQVFFLCAPALPLMMKRLNPDCGKFSGDVGWGLVPFEVSIAILNHITARLGKNSPVTKIRHSGTPCGGGPGTHEHLQFRWVRSPVFMGSGLAGCARAPE